MALSYFSEKTMNVYKKTSTRARLLRTSITELVKRFCHSKNYIVMENRKNVNVFRGLRNCDITKAPV